jgi:threonyl-tRNA synthetase
MLPTILRTQLLDPAGEVAWEGPPSARQEVVPLVVGTRAEHAIVALVGGDPSGDHDPLCSRHDVMQLAEQLGFLSRDGCLRGFVVVLPKGALFDRCVEAFNRAHLAELEASRIDFPFVFDLTRPGLTDLTRSYEEQGRMYRLGGPDENARLIYAADPSLFSWLAGRRLRATDLPYTIYSPLPVFRRWQSGEVGIDRMRQYPVPDLHILCAAGGAPQAYEWVVRTAAANARFWVQEEFALFLDVLEDAYERDRGFGARLARAAGQYTVVNVIDERPRYYAAQSGLMVHAGFGLVQLYNFQWDDTNGERFDIRVAGGEPAAVIHTTIAGGWPKLLPVVLGRGLAGFAPAVVPIELSPVQVACLPVAERHEAPATAYAERLRAAGLRAAVRDRTSRPLGQRLHQVRRSWLPYHAVLGDREVRDEEPVITSSVEPHGSTVDALLAKWGDRLERCRPSEPIARDLPL